MSQKYLVKVYSWRIKIEMFSHKFPFVLVYKWRLKYETNCIWSPPELEIGKTALAELSLILDFVGVVSENSNTWSARRFLRLGSNLEPTSLCWQWSCWSPSLYRLRLSLSNVPNHGFKKTMKYKRQKCLSSSSIFKSSKERCFCFQKLC